MAEQYSHASSKTKAWLMAAETVEVAPTLTTRCEKHVTTLLAREGQVRPKDSPG